MNNHQPSQGGFSYTVAVGFTINYIIGTGFLTIPWANERGGLVLSTLTLTIIALLSVVTISYILEAIAIAESLTDEMKNDNDETIQEEEEEIDSCEEKHDYSNDPSYFDEECLLLIVQDEKNNAMNSRFVYNAVNTTKSDAEYAASNGYDVLLSSYTSRQEQYSSRDDKTFELSELCEIFMGNVGKHVYMVILELDIYGELWAFTTVFCSSMAKRLPFRDNLRIDYQIYAAIFAAIVVPFSCLELHEQVPFQISLSIGRIVVIAIMVLTTLVAACDSDNRVYFTDMEGMHGGAPALNFSGFYDMFSVMCYATSFHVAIPVLSQALTKKKDLTSMFRTAVAICSAAFALLGTSVAWFFGHRIEQSANLNWAGFVGGIPRDSFENSMTRNVLPMPVWVKLVSWFVVLFPAFNVISAYPLNAITLGNNIMGATFGSSMWEFKNDRRVRTIFRLLASVPPILGALAVRELGKITSYTGVFALATAFPVPAVIFISARRASSRDGLQPGTSHHGGVGLPELWAAAIGVFGVSAMIYIFINLLLE